MLGDLAFALAKARFEIVVITSRQTYNDPNASLPVVESVAEVSVTRVPSTRFGRGSLVGRLIDYATFHLFASIRLANLARLNDVVVAKTDPPLISIPAWLICRWRRAKLINWLQDLFPEVLAVELGLIGRPFWLRALEHLRNKSLSAAHKNVVLGQCMADRLNAAGVEPSHISIIENWSDGERVRPIERGKNVLRQQWNLREKFIVGYSAIRYPNEVSSGRAMFEVQVPFLTHPLAQPDKGTGMAMVCTSVMSPTSSGGGSSGSPFGRSSDGTAAWSAPRP